MVFKKRELFGRKFLDALADLHPERALLEVCRHILKCNEFDGRAREEWLFPVRRGLRRMGLAPFFDDTEDDEARALLATLIESFELDLKPPNASDSLVSYARRLRDQLEERCLQREREDRRHLLRSKFTKRFPGKNAGFLYEFTAGDFDRIQVLVNELRTEVRRSEYFDEAHRQRLLARLEALQKEIHKKMSDLDRFYGLVGDAGVVLGKFGRDAAPLVARIKELTEIVWRTQSRTEELPTDSKPALELRDAAKGDKQT